MRVPGFLLCRFHTFDTRQKMLEKEKLPHKYCPLFEAFHGGCSRSLEINVTINGSDKTHAQVLSSEKQRHETGKRDACNISRSKSKIRHKIRDCTTEAGGEREKIVGRLSGIVKVNLAFGKRGKRARRRRQKLKTIAN